MSLSTAQGLALLREYGIESLEDRPHVGLRPRAARSPLCQSKETPAMSNRTFVIGVGMTKFEKPGARDWDYPDMGQGGGRRRRSRTPASPTTTSSRRSSATATASRPRGQRAVYGLGLTGIPVVNVNNNCSTGSSALYMARQAVRGGLADCALALGFEKMEKGSLGVKYTDRTNPIDKHADGDVRGARARGSRRPRRRCSATPAASTWRATAPSPTTTRGSAGRTTSTRSTTRTRSSRTSTRSRTSRRRR